MSGKVYKYGDNIDTDVIIPARYLTTSDPAVLAQHCMADVDKDFAQTVQAGDVIVAGRNFGCGSSREHAPMAIKAAGISYVIARSFARIFYRNAINIGLPIIACDEAVDGIEAGDTIRFEPDTGHIINDSKQETYAAQPFPAFIRDIIQEGGWIAYIQSGKIDE